MCGARLGPWSTPGWPGLKHLVWFVRGWPSEFRGLETSPAARKFTYHGIECRVGTKKQQYFNLGEYIIEEEYLVLWYEKLIEPAIATLPSKTWRKFIFWTPTLSGYSKSCKNIVPYVFLVFWRTDILLHRTSTFTVLHRTSTVLCRTTWITRTVNSTVLAVWEGGGVTVLGGRKSPVGPRRLKNGGFSAESRRWLNRQRRGGEVTQSHPVGS